MHKYEIIKSSKRLFNFTTVYRIRAKKDFGQIKKGDVGGWIEKEENLDQYGNCWVDDEAVVFDDARIRDNVYISEFAQIYGKAFLIEDVRVHCDARVYGEAQISGNTEIFKSAEVFGKARLFGGRIYGEAKVCGEAWVFKNTRIYDQAYICEKAILYTNASVSGRSWVGGQARIYGNVKQTPLVLSGTKRQITLTEEGITIGCTYMSIKEWKKLVKKEARSIDEAFWFEFNYLFKTIIQERNINFFFTEENKTCRYKCLD